MAFPCGPCQGGLPETGEFRYQVTMTGTDEERKKRLAQALRDNLRRRKGQAREEQAGQAVTPATPGADEAL